MKLERRAIEIDATATYELIGVYSFGKGIFHREPTTGSELGDYRFSLIKSGDLVLSNIQAWEGAIAVARPQDENCLGTHRFLTYVPADKRVDTNYLRYLLLSEQGMNLVRKASPGSIARNRTLGITAFESLVVPLPPIDVQRNVAHRLNAFQDAATRVQRLQSKADVMASALPTSLAQRRDFSHRDKEAHGWTRRALREVMNQVADLQVVTPAQTYPNVGILGFGRGLFEKPPIDGARTSARALNRIHAGQFIYSRLFAFEGAYAAVPAQFDGYFVSNEFPTFELDPALDAAYLAAYFRSPAIWAELARSAKGLGVRRQRVHVDALLELEIWLPPIAVQTRVTRQLDLFQRRRAVQERAKKLIEAFSACVLNEVFSDLMWSR